jgi:two-component system, NarL family, sensor histidine kinase DevS
MSTIRDRPDASAGPAEVVDALDAATRAIAGLQGVDEVLQIIVDQVRPLVGARYAALGIVDAAGYIERFITAGMDPDTRARIGPLPQGHGFLGLIIRENRSLRIRDIAVDPRRHGFPPHHPVMHSFLGVPVTLKGRSIGNLYLTDKAGAEEFSEQDQRLVETFALHAGIAIENARLHEEIQRLAIVDERERIGKDLHDGIIQSLYAVGLSLEDVPDLAHEDPDEAERRVERAIDSIHLTIGDIRNFIFGLRPELLSATSLVAGLVAIVDEFRHNSMIDIELEISPVTDPDPEQNAHLLGLVNEALSNVARHSGATRVLVAVSTDDDGDVFVAVRDNGHGFDPSSVAGGFGHHGLANMRSRIATIGGTMDIASDVNGTSIEVRLPRHTGAGAADGADGSHSP